MDAVSFGAFNAQMTDIAQQPKLSFNTLAARTGIKNGDTAAGSYYPICAFCHTYDHLYKNTGVIYAVEEAYTDGRTVQKILKSTDGGNTWTVLGSVTVNTTAGERIQKIYVEPVEETIYLLRAVNINATPVMRLVESYNSTLATKYGTLDIGSHDWHASSQNIDSTHNWTNATVIMAEYGGNENTVMRVWKTTDKGANWTNIYQKTGNNNTPGSGEIRHFHTMQIDPFTGHWWLSSGDTPAQCNIWKSTDSGGTWTLMGGGTEEFRCLGFVFEQNDVYWAMDSTTIGTPVAMFKAPKTDLSQRVILGYQAENYPVYQITKTFFPRGFLTFPQCEPTLTFKGKASIQFYNMDTELLTTVAAVNFSDMDTSKYYGFTGDGSRYQDRINGSILTMLNPDLAARYKHAGGSQTYTGALIGTISM